MASTRQDGRKAKISHTKLYGLTTYQILWCHDKQLTKTHSTWQPGDTTNWDEKTNTLHTKLYDVTHLRSHSHIRSSCTHTTWWPRASTEQKINFTYQTVRRHDLPNYTMSRQTPNTHTYPIFRPTYKHKNINNRFRLSSTLSSSGRIGFNWQLWHDWILLADYIHYTQTKQLLYTICKLIT
jgi:hypothetical protein